MLGGFCGGETEEEGVGVFVEATGGHEEGGVVVWGLRGGEEVGDRPLKGCVEGESCYL